MHQDEEDDILQVRQRRSLDVIEIRGPVVVVRGRFLVSPQPLVDVLELERKDLVFVCLEFELSFQKGLIGKHRGDDGVRRGRRTG